MSTKLRIFAAIALPDDVRDALTGLATPIAGARWLDFDQLHLTLVFIGNAESSRLGQLDDQLRRLEKPSFELKIRGLGHFPGGGRPRALWAGVAPNDSLVALQAAVTRRVTDAGFTLAAKRFVPHVTIARLRSAPDDEIARFLGAFATFELPPFAVKDFQLWSSELLPEGAQYNELQRYPLPDGAPLRR